MTLRKNYSTTRRVVITSIAAEVKDFRNEDLMSAQELRRVGRAAPLLIAAANEAFALAGICWHHHSVADKQSWGVVIGSGGGTADFTEELYRLFFPERLRRVSAYKVSSSTPGAFRRRRRRSSI